MTSFFSAKGDPIWIKFWGMVQNDMSTAVIWSKSKSDVEFQYGRPLCEFHGMSSQSHLPHCRVLPSGEFNVMIPELCVTLQGAATWRIQCHDPIAMCHIAGCWHRVNSMACHPRATYYTAGCCHLVNSLLWFQSHMPHCRVQSPGEINIMIVPHYRV